MPLPERRIEAANKSVFVVAFTIYKCVSYHLPQNSLTRRISPQQRSCPSHQNPTASHDFNCSRNCTLPCRTDVLMSEPAKVKVVWCQHHRDGPGYEAAGEIGRRGLQQQQPADHLDVFSQHHRLHCGLQALPLILELRLSQHQSLFPPPPVGLEREKGGEKVVSTNSQPTGHHLSTNGQRDKFEMCNLISSFFVVRAPWAPFYRAARVCSA